MLCGSSRRFGFLTVGVTPAYLLEHGKILQLGRVPLRFISRLRSPAALGRFIDTRG